MCFRSVFNEDLNNIFHNFFHSFAYHLFTEWRNLALNKPATQSSTYGGMVAGRAVDGNHANDVNDGSCTHTEHGTPPWWRVDLEAKYRIHKVNKIFLTPHDYTKNYNAKSFHKFDTNLNQLICP